MRTFARVNLMFIALLAFWVVLTPKRLDLLFWAMGIGSALLVSVQCRHLAGQLRGPEAASLLQVVWRVWLHVTFVLWLFTRVIPSAIQVSWRCLHPRIPVEPGLLEFHPRLRSPMARALLANAITLVPGTLTVIAEKERFLVHAFYPEAVEDLTSGELQRRVARLYGETISEDPQARWVERVVRR